MELSRKERVIAILINILIVGGLVGVLSFSQQDTLYKIGVFAMVYLILDKLTVGTSLIRVFRRIFKM